MKKYLYTSIVTIMTNDNKAAIAQCNKLSSAKANTSAKNGTTTIIAVKKSDSKVDQKIVLLEVNPILKTECLLRITKILTAEPQDNVRNAIV